MSFTEVLPQPLRYLYKHVRIADRDEVAGQWRSRLDRPETLVGYLIDRVPSSEARRLCLDILHGPDSQWN
jgi:hypothetical protein